MELVSSSRLISIAALILVSSLNPALSDEKLYIVYMGVRDFASDDIDSVSVLHHEMLSGFLGSEEARNAMVYSYTDIFSGFAATLSATNAVAISKLPGVLSVFPSRVRKLHTTRSWEFLGAASYKNTYTLENDVIVGVFDTGVWPESESFSDHLLAPVPSRWRGSCDALVKCNRKLIGARFYSKGYEKEFGRLSGEKSSKDYHGHGTHTASIATGSPVKGADFFGLAQGVARGGAPAARLAVYKVCWGRECSDADVLAAFDDAVSDGVDILSISLGEEPLDYFEDAVAIGGFHAMQKEILTVVSAGNEGPSLHVAKNVAPWLFTVAAGSIDRKFVTDIVLGNHLRYRGAAINGFPIDDLEWQQLISAGSASGNGSKNSQFCGKGTLHPAKVQDKIVVCYADDTRPDESVLLAGGAGLLYVITEGFDAREAFSFAVPANAVNSRHGKEVLTYINSTRRPLARFLPTTVETGQKFKSTVALFSSRGPSLITPDILKPDIIAPGVDILGAWSPKGSVSGLKEDKRAPKFNILSGTSMSCPHVSGAAAYLKSIHPKWSPSALKSALMTTATALDQKHRFNKHGALAYGSGQINPTAATDPGLVYDTSSDDYALFLCSIGYNASQIRLMLNASFKCPRTPASVNSLNYPSVALGNLESKTLNVAITRRVTNVGPPNSTYHATVKAPPHVRVAIVPATLRFEFQGQTRKFKLKLEATGIPKGKFLEGGWEWRDGKHSVRSPIVLWRRQGTSSRK